MSFAKLDTKIDNVDNFIEVKIDPIMIYYQKLEPLRFDKATLKFESPVQEFCTEQNDGSIHLGAYLKSRSDHFVSEPDMTIARIQITPRFNKKHKQYTCESINFFKNSFRGTFSLYQYNILIEERNISDLFSCAYRFGPTINGSFVDFSTYFSMKESAIYTLAFKFYIQKNVINSIDSINIGFSPICSFQKEIDLRIRK